MAKPVFDIQEGKGMSSGQSNEHLRNYKVTDPDAKKYGYYDPTRSNLNFEIGKGGVIMPVRKNYSIVQRFKDNLRNRGIEDPNEIKKKNGMPPNRNTVANIILGGSRNQMHQLAFGEQVVNLERNADNSHIQRKEDIEKWARDMYDYVAKKFGEENICAFIVHLDEKNPHIHCTLIPVNEKGKISYNNVFGNNKTEARKKLLEVHNEVATINKKYGLERGTDINTTGARHRTSEEYWYELRNQSTSMEKVIKKTEIKIKGLSKMLFNLESQKDDIIKQIENLSSEETSKKEQLEKQLQELESKIQDKADKLNEASEQYQYLKTLNSELKKKNDSLRDSNWELEQKNTELRRELKNELEPQQEKKVQDQVSRAMNWYTNNVLKDFYNNNPDIRDVMEQHQIYDIATKSEEIAKTATLLFVGRFDEAINYTLTHGGGGGGDNTLKRDDNDDDWSWMVKCIVSARRMMGRGGRKVKR